MGNALKTAAQAPVPELEELTASRSKQSDYVQRVRTTEVQYIYMPTCLTLLKPTIGEVQSVTQHTETGYPERAMPYMALIQQQRFDVKSRLG